MSINNLPTEIQAIILDETLDTVFDEALTNKHGYRTNADREVVGAGLGETIKKTRPALRAPVQTATTPAGLNDLDSGMTSSTPKLEQYELTLNEYKDMAKTNVVYDRIAIGSKFARDARGLAIQARDSLEMLSRNALFDTYMGGNTRVIAPAVSSANAIPVDDIRGFYVGQKVSVDGAAERVVTAVVAAGSNTSTSFRGISGTVTVDGAAFSATAGKDVRALDAPHIFRAGDVATSALVTGKLTGAQILAAVSRARDNGLSDDQFDFITSNSQIKGLYEDAMFRDLFTGAHNSNEAKNGVISQMLGVRLVPSTMAPVQGDLHRGILVAKGALVEGQFAETGYAGLANAVGSDPLVRVHDGVAHIIREPLDALKQIVTQSWVAVVGYAAPTDMHTTSAVIPTASAARFKRAIILESK